MKYLRVELQQLQHIDFQLLEIMIKLLLLKMVKFQKLGHIINYYKIMENMQLYIMYKQKIYKNKKMKIYNKIILMNKL